MTIILAMAGHVRLEAIGLLLLFKHPQHHLDYLGVA
jgi:hypothetical protein